MEEHNCISQIPSWAPNDGVKRIRIIDRCRSDACDNYDLFLAEMSISRDIKRLLRSPSIYTDIQLAQIAVKDKMHWV